MTATQKNPRDADPLIPVVAAFPTRIGVAAEHRIGRLAARLGAEEPALLDAGAFGAGVVPGLGNGPTLLYEDHGDIPLTPAGDTVLEYRSLLLARAGDLFAIGGARCREFEDYCRDRLGLGRVVLLAPAQLPRNHGRGIAERCRQDERVFRRICQAAREGGQLNLLPFIATGGAWTLAGAIAAESGARVHVAAPPPRLARRVNDKLWFAQQVTALLGQRSRPPFHFAYGPAALAGRVNALARRHERVGIKLPDCAGSAGNIVLNSEMVRALTPTALRRQLLGLLSDLGWRGAYPLKVEVWDCQVISSPSVQIWVPLAEDGPPVAEGIFEQVVAGLKGEFVGAQPTQLSPHWQARLAEEAVLLARLFQTLGYFGRCSFDAVLTGVNLAAAEAHWIECNGRWGGVSIPMTLMNRFVGDWRRRPFVVGKSVV